MSDLDAFLTDVTAAIGARHVLTDPEVTAGQARDWTGRWQGTTPAVLRPGSTDEVAEVVRAAARHGVALVPQGGNTGLVAGATPHAGEVVLDLRRLDELGEVDQPAGQVTVGAGATLAAVQAHVRPTGLMVPVDLASRDSATIGGMVATNAGGTRVIRWGGMRRHVLGLTAVLGTGAVVRVNPAGLLKDNTGYDLAGLLCGSEGTLGVVTEVRLALVPAPAHRVVALLGFADARTMVAAVPVLRAAPGLSALEAMRGSGLELVAGHLGASVPLAPVPPWALLIELAGAGDLTGPLAAALDELGDAVTATAVADDPTGAAGLWRWRESHTEAIAALGPAHKADVTVPLGAMAGFLDEVPAVVRAVAPAATVVLFGHLGDGNIHVNVVGPDPADHSVLDAVFEAVVAAGGSVSAEHGVGVAKRHWLARQRGEEAVAAMRAVKAALDPAGILNPHVLLP